MRHEAIALLVAATAVATASAARTQPGSGASVNATVHFVEPVGVGPLAGPAVALAKPGRGAQAAMTAGSFALIGAKDQTYSVETTARPVLKRVGGPGELRLDLIAARKGSEVQLSGRVAGAEAAPAGLYAGQLATVVNFN